MSESKIDRALLGLLRSLIKPAPLRLALGTPPSAVTPISSATPTVWIRDRRTLLALLRHPQMNFGDLYSAGKIQVEGDLVDLMVRASAMPETVVSRFLSRVTAWFQANTLRGSRRNIHHHYDLSNDFYKLWLDPEMLYTCAYFPDENAGISEAQTAKMDLVCRKLWLKPGETVVEAGCGWGAMALHMARNYGVKVRAFNISHEQIAFARDRAAREGMSDRVEFVEDDYRNISGHYDVFVSIGMLEHVGKSNYPEFSRVIQRSIGDAGRGLLHFIGRNRPRLLNAWIRRRIFPGGYPPTLRDVADIFEPHDYAVLDVENLRQHYARTLEYWLSAYERHFDEVVARFDMTFARMWRLYLAGSAAAFHAGGLQLFQVLFAGRKCASQPWTRARLFESAGSSEDDQCARAMS